MAISYPSSRRLNPLHFQAAAAAMVYHKQQVPWDYSLEIGRGICRCALVDRGKEVRVDFCFQRDAVRCWGLVRCMQFPVAWLSVQEVDWCLRQGIRASAYRVTTCMNAELVVRSGQNNDGIHFLFDRLRLGALMTPVFDKRDEKK